MLGNVENQYVDKDQRVLVNKKGITVADELEVAEEEALAKAYEQLLSELRMDTPMTSDLLRHIHERIFGALYAWAGRWRTVRISKPGAIWPPPDYLDQAMESFEQDVLRKYPAGVLEDDEAFCRAAGEIEGEFLAIHPFREGNARTIKAMVDVLAAQTTRPLLRYDDSPAGRERYIAAARRSLAAQDHGPMAAIIRDALGQGRISPAAPGGCGGESGR